MNFEDGPYHELLGLLLKQDEIAIERYCSQLTLEAKDLEALTHIRAAAKLHFAGDYASVRPALQRAQGTTNEGLKELISVFWHIVPAAKAGDRGVARAERQAIEYLVSMVDKAMEKLEFRDIACSGFISSTAGTMILLIPLGGRLELKRLEKQLRAVLTHLNKTHKLNVDPSALKWLLMRTKLEFENTDLAQLAAEIERRYGFDGTSLPDLTP